MTINPNLRPEDFEASDVGADAFREAAEEIELSPLMTQLAQLREMAETIWSKALEREYACEQTHFSAIELLAEHVLEQADGLEQAIAVICETKAQEERKQAW